MKYKKNEKRVETCRNLYGRSGASDRPYTLYRRWKARVLTLGTRDLPEWADERSIARLSVRRQWRGELWGNEQSFRLVAAQVELADSDRRL